MEIRQYINIFIFSVIFCYATFEVWMSYGLWDGSVNERTGHSNLSNSIIMSCGDGAVVIFIIVLMQLMFGTNVFDKPNIAIFIIFFGLMNLQNVIVSNIIYKRFQTGKISRAPLIPLNTDSVVKSLQPWFILPFIIYPALVNNMF